MLKGKRQLQARFTAIGHTEILIREIVIHGVREAKLLVPRKTGNLGRTIRPGNIRRDYGEIKAGGERNVGYARAVELGAKPHIIRPKNKKALFFPSQKATTERFGGNARLKFNLSGSLSAGSVRQFGSGAFVHAKLVHHPGNKPKPYLVPGLRKAAKEQGIDTIVKLWNGAA